MVTRLTEVPAYSIARKATSGVVRRMTTGIIRETHDHARRIDKPAAGGSGFWRRLRLLECRSPPANPDRTRKAKIRDELGRILNWALTGPEHVDVPSTIVHAVAEYRAESDRLAGWFEACVALDPNAYETARAIWENYRQFCAGVPVDPMTEAGFGRELTERFGTSMRIQVAGKQTRVRLGMRLVTSI